MEKLCLLLLVRMLCFNAQYQAMTILQMITLYYFTDSARQNKHACLIQVH